MNAQRLAGMVCWLLLLGSIAFRASAEPSDAKLEALSKEYQELKIRRKNLKPGTFAHDLSASGGRLSEVLYALGDLLGKPGTPKAQVLRYMGKPDAVLKAGQVQPGAPGAPGGLIQKGDSHLVYFWRGWHDYLYFVCRDGVIVKVQHYAALE